MSSLCVRPAVVRGLGPATACRGGGVVARSRRWLCSLEGQLLVEAEPGRGRTTLVLRRRLRRRLWSVRLCGVVPVEVWWGCAVSGGGARANGDGAGARSRQCHGQGRQPSMWLRPRGWVLHARGVFLSVARPALRRALTMCPPAPGTAPPPTYATRGDGPFLPGLASATAFFDELSPLMRPCVCTKRGLSVVSMDLPEPVAVSAAAGAVPVPRADIELIRPGNRQADAAGRVPLQPPGRLPTVPPLPWCDNDHGCRPCRRRGCAVGPWRRRRHRRLRRERPFPVASPLRPWRLWTRPWLSCWRRWWPRRCLGWGELPAFVAPSSHAARAGDAAGTIDMAPCACGARGGVAARGGRGLAAVRCVAATPRSVRVGGSYAGGAATGMVGGAAGRHARVHDGVPGGGGSGSGRTIFGGRGQ